MKTKNAPSRRFLSSAAVITVVVAIFTFLSLFPSAFAANPVIFDGGVISGHEYTTTTGDVFTATYVPSEQKIIVDFPGDSLIIENKTCNTGKKLQGCFDGAIFKGYNRSLPIPEVYEAKLKLSMVVPEIKIVKFLGKEEVEVGEETTASVNVTNTGAATAAVYFTEKIPAELKLAELPGERCQLSSGNTLVLAGDLTVGEVWRCDYKVTALSPGTHVIKSSAAFDVIKRETVEASASLKVKDLPFLVTATYPSALLLGEKFNMTLVLKSNDKIGSFVFNALIPAQFSSTLLTNPFLPKAETATAEKRNEGLVVHYGDKTASLNGSAEINVISEAAAVGEFAVTSNASWLLGSIKQQTAKGFQINVTFAKPYFRLGSYDNKTGQASIDVVNPAHLPIFNISLSFGSFTGLNNKQLIVEEISSLSYASVDIVQKTQDGTEVGSSGNYSGEIRYYTLYGQKLIETAVLPINASQLPKAAMPVSETPQKASEAEQPAAEENKTEEAVVQEQAKPERKSGFAGFRVAAAMVGTIIILMVVFLMLKAKKEEKVEETELENAGKEEERPDFEKY